MSRSQNEKRNGSPGQRPTRERCKRRERHVSRKEQNRVVEEIRFLETLKNLEEAYAMGDEQE